MKKHPVFTYLLGVLTSVLIFNFASPAIAAAASKMIEVFPGISIYVDDQKLDPRDANGNPVEVFAHNGTTYLPVRAITEAFGKPAYWDSETQSVYIGYHNTGTNQPTAPSNPTPAPTPTPTPTPTPAPTPSESTNRTVYITRTGKKYHYSNTCNGGTYYRSTLQEALNRGLKPCEKCVLH